MASNFFQNLAEQQTPTEEGRFERMARESGSDVGPVGAFLGATNEEILNIAGAPVDLLNFGSQLTAQGLESVGIGSGDALEIPGGSEDLNAAFNQVGVGLPGEIEDLPRAAQIGARAGQVVGASIPFAAAPLAAARANVFRAPIIGSGRGFGIPTGTGNVLNPVVEGARSAPRAFTAIEAAGIGGAAQGAALAEAFAPGNVPVRVGAEIAGGFINPAGLLGRLVSNAGRSASTTFRAFTPAGRQSRASEVIQGRLVEMGEDPAEVAQTLRAANDIKTPLTAGQASGSQALLDLEAKIARSNRPFGRDAEKRLKDALENVQDQLGRLKAEGSPAALRIEAKLRQDAFDNLLAERIRGAEQRAAEAAARIGPSQTRAQASTEAFEELNQALRDAREVERTLWEQVPKDLASPLVNVRAARDRIADELLEGEKVPLEPQLNGLLRSEIASSGDILKLRNRALALSRDATGRGDFSTARQLNDIADGALDDLEGLQNPFAQEARDFSRTLNDKFTRSFGGQALARDRTGQRRIPPELMLERAFGRGGVRGDLQFRQLQEAAEFSGLPGAMRNQQEAFLRDVSDQLMTNGIADPEKIRLFLGTNEELMSRFPALRADLEDARTASRLLEDVTTRNQSAQKAVRQKAAFGRLIDAENPAVEVGKILNGPNPSREYSQLARLARRAGAGTMAGLKTSTLDVAMNAARSADGSFSFSRLKEQLDPRRGAGLINRMLKNKVMAPAEASRLRKLVDRAVELENISASSTGDLLEETDPLTDLVIRMAGVRIASVSPLATQGPGQIVAAGAGSRFARRIFEKVPQTRVADVLTEAAADPKFMAALLERPRTPARRRALERQLNSFLIGTGITAD